MFQVSIDPIWLVRDTERRELAPRVIELLAKIDETGSLSSASKAMGCSYRHAWQLVHEGEAFFGQALVAKERGRGSALLPLGQRLVWARRRIHARLAPLLETLASELGGEIARSVASTAASGLRVHASHGFAIQALHELLGEAGVGHELKYCGSAEALASLRQGSCEIAGFHVPVGEFENEALATYRPWLKERVDCVIRLASRQQGLIVQAGNPRKIYDFSELVRPDVRFINRQLGSGTRLLLDLALRRRGIDSSAIHGYEQCEFTHAAVAAYVASGMADVGFGVEVPARRFKLDFLPLFQERYFLLCEESNLNVPAIAHLIEILRSREFQARVDPLPGYQAVGAGNVLRLSEAFGQNVP